MIIHGSRLFGKVDAVPGLVHVATKFFHINFLPLIPTETWLVTEQSGSEWRGVPIPMSGKSVLVEWGRFCLGAWGVAGLNSGGIGMGSPGGDDVRRGRRRAGAPARRPLVRPDRPLQPPGRGAAAAHPHHLHGEGSGDGRAAGPLVPRAVLPLGVL